MLVKVILVLLVGVLISVHAAEVKASVNASVEAGAPAHTTTTTTTLTTEKNGKKTPKPHPTKPPKGTTTTPATTTTSPKQTPPPKAGKYNCGVCTGPGTDCKPTTWDKDVDFCVKITGTVDDPKTVPSSFFSILQFAGMGDIKKLMEENKGKVATIRKGAPPALIALSGQKWNEEGCSDYPIFLGMKNANACLCKGDCTN